MGNRNKRAFMIIVEDDIFNRYYDKIMRIPFKDDYEEGDYVFAETQDINNPIVLTEIVNIDYNEERSVIYQLEGKIITKEQKRN